jgi:hypothetical protein
MNPSIPNDDVVTMQDLLDDEKGKRPSIEQNFTEIAIEFFTL